MLHVHTVIVVVRVHSKMVLRPLMLIMAMVTSSVIDEIVLLLLLLIKRMVRLCALIEEDRVTDWALTPL